MEIWVARPSAVIPSCRMSSSASEICRLSPSAVAVREVMFPSALDRRTPSPAAVMARSAMFSSPSSILAYMGSVMEVSYRYTAVLFMLLRSRLCREYRSCSTSMNM